MYGVFENVFKDERDIIDNIKAIKDFKQGELVMQSLPWARLSLTTN